MNGAVFLGKPYLFTFKTKAMRNVRLIMAVSLMLSLMAVTSVAYAYASDHSPGVQHELVMQMTTPYDATQTFEPVHPGEAAVPFGVRTWIQFVAYGKHTDEEFWTNPIPIEDLI